MRLLVIGMILLLCAFWAAADEGNESTTIVLGAADITSGHLCGNIIKKAYLHMGIEAQIKYLPAARSLALSSQGMLDGEVSRVFSVGDRYKTLVRVPASYLSFHGKVFTLKPSVRVNKPLDLRNYSSGILNGIVYSEKLTHSYKRIYGNSASQLFHMLIADHLNMDLVILTEVTGRTAIAHEFPSAGIKMAKGNLMDLPVYHYLHESKKALLPKIEAVIRNMLASGEIDAIKESFINDYRGDGEK